MKFARLAVAEAVTVMMLAACGGSGGGDEATAEAAAADAEQLSQAEAVRSSSGWQQVASEGGSFTLSKTTTVRYGISGSFATRTLAASSYACSNSTFGDPAVGRNKVCQVSTATTTAAATPAPAPAATPAPAPASPAPAPSASPAPAPTTSAPAPAPTAAPAPAPSTPSSVISNITSVVASLIPAAAGGSAERRIQNSGEMPYRDPDGMGAFRTVCQYSHMNFDDPLVYPGQAGKAHLHVFFGNTGTNANSTPESIRTTGSGSCRGGIVNRSAYWAPAVIDTRTGAPVRPAADADIYYKTGYSLFGQNSAVQAFPVGFRMIASDSKSQVQQEKAFFECNGSRANGIPNCAGGELRQIIEFPQCWDGRNLDSPDHRSHIIYASNGSCPSTHPVHTPEITMIIKYNVPSSGAGSWRLSSDINGAPAGSSGHGDWMNGWEQEVHETFVARVIRQGLSGGSHIVGDGRTIY